MARESEDNRRCRREWKRRQTDSKEEDALNRAKWSASNCRTWLNPAVFTKGKIPNEN